MKNILFLIVVFLLSSQAFAQQENNLGQRSMPQECTISTDTLFVQRTETSMDETYKLIFYKGGTFHTLYSLTTEAGDDIEYLMSYKKGGIHYACFAVYNNVADGDSYLFFDWTHNRLYLTFGCYADFDPIAESVDFSEHKVLLANKWGLLDPNASSDTLRLGNSPDYFGYNRTVKCIEVNLKCLQTVK